MWLRNCKELREVNASFYWYHKCLTPADMAVLLFYFILFYFILLTTKKTKKKDKPKT